jgi:hypothetical protein
MTAEIETVRARIPGADRFYYVAAHRYFMSRLFIGSQVPTETAVLQEKMYSRLYFLSKQKFLGQTLVMGNKYLTAREIGCA